MTARLTGAERRAIDEARKVATVRTADIREYTGDDDMLMAYAVAFGRAQWHLNDLLRLVERLAVGDEDQAAEDTRRLNEIRKLLAGFDWEYHDRQLALEAIERIAEGGQA